MQNQRMGTMNVLAWSHSLNGRQVLEGTQRVERKNNGSLLSQLRKLEQNTTIISLNMCDKDNGLNFEQHPISVYHKKWWKVLVYL